MNFWVERSYADAVVTTDSAIDKVYFDDASDYEVDQGILTDLLKQAHVSADVELIELMRKDSLDLTDVDRDLIRDTVRHLQQRQVVITRGTDTMVDTARVLTAVTDKVIVLTGSLRLRDSRQQTRYSTSPCVRRGAER
jgi:L-asparaginase